MEVMVEEVAIPTRFYLYLRLGNGVFIMGRIRDVVSSKVSSRTL